MKEGFTTFKAGMGAGGAAGHLSTRIDSS
jgi:hypothetical protein